MTSEQAIAERTRLWSELKPLLRRSLGPRGAADWLAFAAEQERMYAARVESNVIELEAAR